MDRMQGEWIKENVEVCDFRYDEGFRSRKDRQLVPTITTRNGEHQMSGVPMVLNKTQKMRIRRLTPRETWRLMGFTDEDFDKASKVVSDTQLYKQAGNSIVVDVLEAIFKEML